MDTSQRRQQAADGASWVPLIAVALGYFMVILDATGVNLALPALSRDLGGGVTGLQWVVDGYTLAFAALLLSAGVRRRPVRPAPGVPGRAGPVHRWPRRAAR